MRFWPVACVAAVLGLAAFPVIGGALQRPPQSQGAVALNLVKLAPGQSASKGAVTVGLTKLPSPAGTPR